MSPDDASPLLLCLDLEAGLILLGASSPYHGGSYLCRQYHQCGDLPGHKTRSYSAGWYHR